MATMARHDVTQETVVESQTGMFELFGQFDQPPFAAIVTKYVLQVSTTVLLITPISTICILLCMGINDIFQMRTLGSNPHPTSIRLCARS